MHDTENRPSARLATALIIATLALAAAGPAPAEANPGGTPGLQGQVLNMGSGKPNGVLRLKGTLSGIAGVNLGAAKLRVISLLAERRGSLELVSANGAPLVPIELTPRPGSNARTAIFESQSSPGDPRVRVVMTRRSPRGDTYSYSITAERVLIAPDHACTAPGATTERRSRLSLDDGTNGALSLSVRHQWQCRGKRLMNPAPVADVPPGEGGTAEGAILDLAFDLAKDVAGDQLNDALFPGDSIDYETLIKDFESVVKEALQENDIQQDSNTINGILLALNSLERLYANGQDACSTLPDVNSQLDNLNIFIGRFQGYGQAGLSGWVSAAQTLLSALRFKQRLKSDPAILACTTQDLASNEELAANLDAFVWYLAGQRNAVLHQNILDSIHYCHREEQDDEQGKEVWWQYLNCTGQEHLPFDTPEACENDALVKESDYCAQATFDDQTNQTSGSDGNVAWMAQVIEQWQQALVAISGPDANGQSQLPDTALPCATCGDALETITVDKMMTGVRNTVPVETTAWLKAACDGLQSCDYQLQPSHFAQESDGQESTDALQTVQAIYRCGSDPTPRVAFLSGVGDPSPALYKGAYLHLDCAPRVTNTQVLLAGQPIDPGFGDIDVSTGARLDAGKITDGIVAPKGHSAADTAYVIVLPHTQSAGALVIDLGAPVQICGNGFDCYGEPEIQADNDDTYQLDYSLDGVTWTKYGVFPAVSGSGLHTRTFDCNTRPNLSQPCSASNNGPNFTARYVRVFGVSGGNTFSVSELTLWNTSSQVVSVGKSAVSNYVPLITNGVFAPGGTKWNDATSASVLTSVGPGSGLTIDLGQLYGALDGVEVQVDSNDHYQVDVSTDGATWLNWYSVWPVSGGGLQTRASGPLPPSAGRYVRVYAVLGDGEYSVSEVQVTANTGEPVCGGDRRVCGLSGATVLEQAPGAPASDLVVSWTCGTETTGYLIDGVPWVVSRNGLAFPDPAVMQLYCLPTTVTCTDPSLHPTTCSHFAEDAPNDVVYTRVANIPYQLSAGHASCPGVLAGKTNYYHSDPASPATHSDPACINVRRAIHDAVAEGACPAGIGADAGTSWTAWPYNIDIGTGSAATPIIDPALGHPPLLQWLGCNSLLQ
jgi:hypothetical protein